MSEHSVYEIFFRCVCFVFFVAAVGLFFKVYILPEIYTGIDAAKKVLENLGLTQRSLAQMHTESIKETTVQDQYAQHLLNKIAVWHERQLKREERQLQLQEASKLRIKNYLNDRVTWIVQQCAAREVLPEAYKQASQGIKNKFADQVYREKFLSNALARIEKEAL